jgi:hypothetical protein
MASATIHQQVDEGNEKCPPDLDQDANPVKKYFILMINFNHPGEKAVYF